MTGGVLDQFALPGRKAVVTGASRGLGRAFALALAQAGADVAAVARTGPDIKAAAEDIAARTGRRVVPVVADITQRADAERMIAEADAALGGLDILVNNAGVCFHRPALDVPDEEFRQVFDVNVYGLWVASTEAAKRMMATGGGAIVNIGSISSIIVNRPQWQPAYNASKAAVHHLTKSLAAEWGARGVRVNSVAPTYINTPLTAYAKTNRAMYETWMEMTPIGRMGEPDEIASIVLFLASDASSLMTGSIVLADGGYTCW